MGAAVAVTVRFRPNEVLDELEHAKKPISQSELSRRSGVSLATMNAMVLNKTKQLSLARLDAISRALGVEPGELLERDAKRGRR